MQTANATVQDTPVYDLIGIGFGPSNLALAPAIEEQSDASELNALFLDQHPEFQWHSNMLIPGTEMQISFLKDLVTLRNPCSPYTFLNYLKGEGRLASFSNLRSFYPSRVEFHDYMSWVARQLYRYVRYSQRVTAVRAAGVAPHTLFEVVSDDLLTGATRRFFARNVVVAPGVLRRSRFRRPCSPTAPAPSTARPT